MYALILLSGRDAGVRGKVKSKALFGQASTKTVTGQVISKVILPEVMSPEILSQSGCVTAVQFILFNFANYSPSIAMELKVSKETASKGRKQRPETSKYVS